VLLQALGKSALGSEASYLPAGVLISCWTSITLPGLLVTALGFPTLVAFSVGLPCDRLTGTRKAGRAFRRLHCLPGGL
jgi:hypothetical protein